MLLCFAALFAQGNLHDSRSAYKPEASVSDLMVLNKQLQKTLKSEPANDKDWKENAHNARLLAEIGNLLTRHQPETETDWQKHAERFRLTARRVAAASDAKDLEKAMTAYHELVTTCKPCHNKYR